MILGQETYVGDSKLLLVGAPTSVSIALISGRDGVGGSFKGRS
jgi:hypothetical protein